MESPRGFTPALRASRRRSSGAPCRPTASAVLRSSSRTRLLRLLLAVALLLAGELLAAALEQLVAPRVRGCVGSHAFQA